MPALPPGVRIRRVGFRDGTDEELRALHAVESEVEAERRPDLVPQPVESYLAFARSLPSQFDDHTWLVEADDGVPLATAACWSNSAGDPLLMECDVFVRRAWRRRGIATHLLDVIAATTADEDRRRLTWSTYDTVPAGEQLSRRVGGAVARVNRTSELPLVEADWPMVERWMTDGPERARGYRIEVADSPLPPSLHADAAALHHIMQTQPRDGLEVADELRTADDIAERERAQAEAGREWWTMFARDPSGACVGGTEVTYEPWAPATVSQQNTGIHPDHRGLGLAKWVKAAMLLRVRAERPGVERIRTSNAFSNAPMLAINDALGFRVISSRTEWQAEVEVVRSALALL
jgi:GNAT superfamily N-acetyltransferase